MSVPCTFWNIWVKKMQQYDEFSYECVLLIYFLNLSTVCDWINSFEHKNGFDAVWNKQSLKTSDNCTMLTISLYILPTWPTLNKKMCKSKHFSIGSKINILKFTLQFYIFVQFFFYFWSPSQFLCLVRSPSFTYTIQTIVGW